MKAKRVSAPKGEQPRALPRWVDPPPGLVGRLESAARKDLRIARLTLGLFGSILGEPSSQLFPGYTWIPTDLEGFPASLRPVAQRILEWGQTPGAFSNKIHVSRLAIIKAVYAIRRRSPFGRKHLKVAARLRRKYPLNGKSMEPPPETTNLHTMDVLEDVTMKS